MTQPFYLPNGNLYIGCFLNRLIVAYTKRHHNSILDVGCGSGNLLEFFRSFGMKKVVGCDISSKAREACKSKDIKFDIVVCTQVLEHLKHPSLVVKELYRVAKDIVLFIIPAGDSYASPNHIHHWWSFGEVAERLLPKAWTFSIEVAISKPADAVIPCAAFVVGVYKNIDSSVDLVSKVVVEATHPHRLYIGGQNLGNVEDKDEKLY